MVRAAWSRFSKLFGYEYVLSLGKTTQPKHRPRDPYTLDWRPKFTVVLVKNHCRHRFPQIDTDGNYYMEVGGLYMEVFDWLRENCPSRCESGNYDPFDETTYKQMYYVRSNTVKEPIYIWFRDPNDAVAFQLRWG